MRLIGDLLESVESQHFVGREAELALMQDELVQHDGLWRILHFHGPGGMGKTSLLRKMAKETLGNPVLYFNVTEKLRRPEQFITQMSRIMKSQSISNIEELVNELNVVAAENDPLVILFDSLELWNPIKGWLFESFLPKLSTRIRIFTAGRYPLEGKWDHAPSWNAIVKNIALKPLDNNAVHEYILSKEIQDPVQRDMIARLCNGIPFALRLCCMAVKDGEHRFEGATLKQTVGLLCQSVLDGLPLTGKQRNLLDAASMVWRFDQDLLRSITGHELDIVEFQQFCDLPVVFNSSQGWSLLDGIRNWIRTDFKDRSPDTFEQFKQNTFDILLRRQLTASPAKKTQRFCEMIYGIENDLIRDYYFSGGAIDYDLRPLAEEDLPNIEQMWRNWFPEVPPFTDDDSRQDVFFRPVWNVSPSSYTGFWDGNQFAAFSAVVPLNVEIRNIFKNNPPYRHYMLHSEPQVDEVLIWLGASSTINDFDAASVVFRHSFEQLLHKRLITLVTPVDNHASALLSLGFVELPWAKYISTSGRTYTVMQLDLRNQDIFELLFGQNANSTLAEVPLEQAVIGVKKMLIAFTHLESEQLLLQSLPQLLSIPIRHADKRSSAEQIREMTKQALRSIAERSDKDRMIVRALELTYIQRVAAQDMIANRLHMSISTYYRYLKIGIEKLTLELINQAD